MTHSIYESVFTHSGPRAVVGDSVQKGKKAPQIGLRFRRDSYRSAWHGFAHLGEPNLWMVGIELRRSFTAK